MAEALQSGHYHIKWTTCSDLPTPMCDAYIAVSNGTVYCTGLTPSEDNQHKVYAYNTKTNQWRELPRPGHRLGVIHMLGDKLAILGGRDSGTDKIHEKVTTYNSKSNTWSKYFPNMLNVRLKPGVITYNDYVIVLGGKYGQDTIHDSIEVMNYRDEQMQWKEVPLHLPVSMWGIKPTISGKHITIVGCTRAKGHSSRCYRTPVDNISFLTEPDATCTQMWGKFSPTPHFYTAIVPNSSPPIIIGGSNDKENTSDVTLHDKSKDSWRKVDSLTTARKLVGLGLLNNSSVIVVGGRSKVWGTDTAKSSALATVEIGGIVPNQRP